MASSSEGAPDALPVLSPGGRVPAPARQTVGRRRHRRGADAAAAVLPGLVLATALTAWHWSSKPLWRDEWITWSITVRPWGSMVELLSERDGGLWPFYALMHAWMRVDDSASWMRVPSGVATVLAVVVTALVARRLAGPLAGALSGVVLAVLPAVVAHAQQARAYPEVMAAAALTALLALRYREAPTTRRGVALAAGAALTVVIHPLPGTPAVVGVMAAVVIAPGAASRWRLLLAGAPATAAAAVLVAVGARETGLVLTAQPGGWDTVARFRLVLASEGWTLAVIGVLAVAGLLAAWRRERGPALLLTAWALTPPLVLAALVAAGSFSTRRYLVAALPAVAVLVAVGALALAAAIGSAAGGAATGKHTVVAVALVAVVVAGLAPYAAAKRTAPYAGDDPRSAARHLQAHQRPGDVAVYAGPFARGLTAFSTPPVAALPDPLLARDRLASDTVDGVEIPPDRQRAAAAGAPRLWVVATRDGRALEGQATIDRVTAGRTRVEQRRFGGVVVQRWGPLEP